MAGSALTAVETIISQAEANAQNAVSSAESALAALGGLSFSRSWLPHYYTRTMAAHSPGALSEPNAIASITPPALASVTIDPDRPVRPETDYPDMPELFTLAIPEAPLVEFPTFDESVPEYDVSEPVRFDIDVGTYSEDALVPVTRDRLVDNIRYGGTGLLPEIEEQIWDRDLERNERQLEDSTDKVLAMWAKKGFTLPDGMLAHSLAEVQKEYLNRSIDRSREIAIKQAEMEQTNIFKSMEIGLSLVSTVYGVMVKYEELAVMARQATVQFANDYIRLQIETYKTKMDGYRAMAQVYEIEIRAGIAKVELYQAQIQAELAKAEVNKALIAAYSEEIRAIATMVDAYKAEVQAMVAELEVEKTKLEANKLQFDTWAKRMDVEISKYNGAVELYKANVALNVAGAELATKAEEANIRVAAEFARVNVASAEVEQRTLIAEMNAQMEAARGVAQSASSMAAGAMAAVAAHANLGYSESMSLEEA